MKYEAKNTEGNDRISEMTGRPKKIGREVKTPAKSKKKTLSTKTPVEKKTAEKLRKKNFTSVDLFVKITVDRKIVDRKTVVCEHQVKTPLKTRSGRKSVDTPLKTPVKEIKSHAKDRGVSQTKSLKKGKKKKESLEQTAMRLKLVKVKS
jgi:hypothetical protein